LTLTFLVSASRAELVRQVIRPALDAGHIVIADRYADSTLAYQAYGMGVSRGDVEMLTRVATGGLVPDLSLYIRLPEEVSRERLRGRQDGNRLDDETFAFHQRVRAGYDQLIEEEPERWAVIDGNAPAEAVHRAVLAAVAPLLRPEGTTR
jgi:dTMP kinase